MRTMFLRMVLGLVVMAAFVSSAVALEVRQPVPLEDQRFNGQFYYRSDRFYGFWEFDGTSRVVFTGYNPQLRGNPNFVHIREFRIYENGLIRWRFWYDDDFWSDDPRLVSFIGYISGPYVFSFNDDGNELRIWNRIGPMNIRWRTYTRR